MIKLFSNLFTLLLVLIVLILASCVQYLPQVSQNENNVEYTQFGNQIDHSLVFSQFNN